MDKPDDIELLNEVNEKFNSIKKELSKKIIGYEDILEMIFSVILSGGHAILEGVPGLAKTLLVSSVSEVMDLSFNRVQFTPDLMPSDITGSEILHEDKRSGEKTFKFVKGPLFTNILLADEINRTPPKTQSALLQAMQESTVTSSGYTYELPSPFIVLATQNPIEQEGTYPLPEAQQDRFMYSIKLDYPDHNSEIDIVKMTTGGESENIRSVILASDIQKYKLLLKRVPVAENVVEYAVKLARATRPENNENMKKYLVWGAGPRASQYLVLAAKARSLLNGRPSPDTTDVKKMAKPVLRHRISRSFSAEAESIQPEDIIDRIIQEL